MEWSHDTTLKIPNVQKLNEGSYQCVVSNCAGSQTSTAAKLCIGKNPDINHNSMKHPISILVFLHTADPPCITTHPKGLKDAVPGQPVTFTVHATGTEPIRCQWQWKPPAGDEQEGSDWKLCGMEWSHNTTLRIPSIKKLNEGSYQCIISNCAGFQISKAAKLSIGMNFGICCCCCCFVVRCCGLLFCFSLSNVLLCVHTYS